MFKRSVTAPLESGLLGESSTGSAGSSTLSRHEYVDILAKRVLYSRAYTGFYVTLIGAGLVEVVWIMSPDGGGVGHLPDHGAFTVVESYVTVGLILELALRAVLQRRLFWTQVANLFDLFVVLVSVFTTVLAWAGAETRSEALVADLLVTGRVFFRLFRLLAITKSYRRQQATSDQKLKVEFDDGADSPMVDVESGRGFMEQSLVIDVEKASATEAMHLAEDDDDAMLPSPREESLAVPFGRPSREMDGVAAV